MSVSTHDPTYGLEQLRERLQSVTEILELADDALRESSRVKDKTDISFVIPVHDEELSIDELFTQIRQNVPLDRTFEVIFVDDGSQDDSWTIIRRLAEEHPDRVRGLRLRLNAGKATALAAGFRVTRGSVVFSMDGDLQDDPREIPRFLSKLDEGVDLVCGWKRVRHDPWHKVVPSRVFNHMLSLCGGVRLHDHNCGFKCFRGELVRELTLHGELHRMIPSLAGMLGYRSVEIEIKHHPRQSGRSKYGFERYLRGFSDMLTVDFLRRYRDRPAHFFNAMAGMYVMVAILLTASSLIHPASPTIATLQLLTAGLFGGMGLAVFMVGLVAELIIRGPIRRERTLPIAFDTGIDTDDPGKNQFAGETHLKIATSDKVDIARSVRSPD